MKMLRLFVLVLLAMLLPLRGVSAAALLCEQPSMLHTQLVVDAHDHDTVMTPAHDHAGHDHSHGAMDKARHCLSSCSAPPLMGTAPTVLMPTLVGIAVFPHFAAPAPTFQSDGQDRPPRST